MSASKWMKPRKKIKPRIYTICFPRNLILWHFSTTVNNFLKIPLFPRPKNDVRSKQKTFLIIVIIFIRHNEVFLIFVHFMRKIGFGMKWKKCIIIEHLKINIIAARTENFRTKKTNLHTKHCKKKILQKIFLWKIMKQQTNYILLVKQRCVLWIKWFNCFHTSKELIFNSTFSVVKYSVCVYSNWNFLKHFFFCFYLKKTNWNSFFGALHIRCHTVYIKIHGIDSIY